MPAPNHAAVPATLDPSDPLAQLNDGFLEYYAARQRAVLAELGPSVACIDDSLYLRIDGRRLVGPARTRRYHELKVVCHLPLAIQTIVGDAGGQIDDETRERLVELGRRTAAVLDTIDDRGLEPEQLARQRRLLTASQHFIAAISKAPAVEAEALRAFLKAQVPDIRRNVEEAARDQLQTTHATFSAWVATMSREQWSQLRVVVGAAHMARSGNAASQYFSLVLGDSWEGRFETEDHEKVAQRVLTSEDATDEETAFTLLAMHAFDRRAANVFFGDEGRLGRDILADTTEQQLTAMFGARPTRAAE